MNKYSQPIPFTKQVHYPFYSRQIVAKQNIKPIHNKETYHLIMIYKLHSIAKIFVSVQEIYFFLFSNSDRKSRQYFTFLKQCLQTMNKTEQLSQEQTLLQLFGRFGEQQQKLLQQLRSSNQQNFPQFNYQQSIKQILSQFCSKVSPQEYSQFLRQNSYKVLNLYQYIGQKQRNKELQKSLVGLNCRYIRTDLCQEIEQDINLSISLQEQEQQNEWCSYTLEQILATQQDQLSDQIKRSLERCLAHGLQIGVDIHPKYIVYVEHCAQFVWDVSHMFMSTLNLKVVSVELKHIVRNVEADVYHAIDYTIDQILKKKYSSQGIHKENKEEMPQQHIIKKQINKLKAAFVYYHFVYGLGVEGKKQQEFKEIYQIVREVIGLFQVIPWIKVDREMNEKQIKLYKFFTNLN